MIKICYDDDGLNIIEKLNDALEEYGVQIDFADNLLSDEELKKYHDGGTEIFEISINKEKFQEKANQL